ncbi:hypothetical protein [Sulfurimonas sp.]|uniref:hypothetical protein n=1 Tax=Sulfurimonas sp. TaxID=2022749 RepID=UPI00356A04B3
MEFLSLYRGSIWLLLTPVRLNAQGSLSELEKLLKLDLSQEIDIIEENKDEKDIEQDRYVKKRSYSVQ